jgi:hypothetical protein
MPDWVDGGGDGYNNVGVGFTSDYTYPEYARGGNGVRTTRIPVPAGVLGHLDPGDWLRFPDPASVGSAVTRIAKIVAGGVIVVGAVELTKEATRAEKVKKNPCVECRYAVEFQVLPYSKNGWVVRLVVHSLDAEWVSFVGSVSFDLTTGPEVFPYGGGAEGSQNGWTVFQSSVGSRAAGGPQYSGALWAGKVSGKNGTWEKKYFNGWTVGLSLDLAVAPKTYSGHPTCPNSRVHASVRSKFELGVADSVLI